jgi:hypothetical protein
MIDSICSTVDLASIPSDSGSPVDSDTSATAGMVMPMPARAEPSARFRLVCRRSARAAWSAAIDSGSSTTPAMMMPTSDSGAPAASRTTAHRQAAARRRRHALHAERLFPVTGGAGQQAQADHTVQDDHDGGKDRVARQPGGRCAARDRQGNDQGDLDGGHGHRQHQRAEGLADPVRHHLRMEHGGQHAGNQAGHQKHGVPGGGARTEPGARQQQPGGDRGRDRPDRDPDGGAFVRRRRRC